MKRSCLALLGALVLMGASLAMADGDPNIKLSGAPHDGFVVTGDTFSFTTSGSGDTVFTNGSGQVWSELIFTVSGNTNSPVTCSVTFKGFSTCGSTDAGDVITFSGGLGISAGEFPGDDFQVVLNGWSPGTNFSVTAVPSAAPEPSSLLMLASGLLGVGGLLRRRFVKVS